MRFNKRRVAFMIALFVPCPILLFMEGLESKIMALGQFVIATGYAATSGITRQTGLPHSLAEARRRWQDALERYQKHHTQAGFEAKRKKLSSVRDKLIALQTGDPATHSAYLSLRKSFARDLFLRSKRLEDADIPGLSDKSRAALLKQRVKTAADCRGSKLEKAADSDETYRAAREWRARVARRFRFDAKTPLPPKAENRLIDDFLGWQLAAKQELEAGAKQLQSLSRSITWNRSNNYQALADAWEAVRILEAQEQAAAPTERRARIPRRNGR